MDRRELFQALEAGPVPVKGLTKLAKDLADRGLVEIRSKKIHFTLSGAFAWRKEREEANV